MKQFWSPGGVITLILLFGVGFVGCEILASLDHQQAQIVMVVDQVKEIRSTLAQPSREITSSLDRQQEQLTTLADQVRQLRANLSEMPTVPVGGGGHAPAEAPPQEGKDEYGRPYAATPGFTMVPPPGSPGIPGFTALRRPEFVPELCGSYVAGEISEPDKINYYLTNDGLTSQIDRLVHERLFNLNLDNPTELRPELAVAWETSDDKLTYRFHLRKGVVFSDGSPFDADDILFSYNALMDPGVESEHLKSGFDLVESVRKVDQWTVEVRMRKRYWKALKQFGYSLRVLSNEYFEREIPKRAKEHGIAKFSTVPGEPGFADVFNKFDRVMPPGTGPYMWRDGESWVTNQHITLFANLSAWKRKLNPDWYRIETHRWRIIRDDVARHEEFRKGALDVLVVDHNSWEDRLSKDPTITSIANHYTYDHIGLLYNYLSFNCRRFPFDDVRVRRAVAHLMDRPTILKELTRGHGSIATCPTKPIYPEYSHDIVPRKFDPDEAKRILAEAGWRDTDGDGLLDKDGRPLEFTFAVPTGRTFFITVTTLLQDACRSVGIRCKSDPKEWSLFIEDFYNRNFDLVCLYASAADPWIDLFEEFHSSQAGPRAGNECGWVNPEVDSLLETMREEFDDQKRAGMFHRFNHIFDDAVPRFLLIHGEVGVLLNKRIRGAKIRPTGLQPHDLWIAPEDARR